ncbi:MAG: hypothetical protein AB6733_20390 [Clostridiaceae bacterium]
MRIFKKRMIILLTLIFLVVGCSKVNNETKVITTPDRLFIYYNGEKLEANSKHEDFNKIVDLTNERIKKEDLSMVLDSMDIDKKISDKKNTGISIEFIYNDEQETTIADTDGDSLIKYNRLFFQLSPDSDDFDKCFQYGNNEQYIGSCIGPSKEPKSLLNFITNRFKK